MMPNSHDYRTKNSMILVGRMKVPIDEGQVCSHKALCYYKKQKNLLNSAKSPILNLLAHIYLTSASGKMVVLKTPKNYG